MLFELGQPRVGVGGVLRAEESGLAASYRVAFDCPQEKMALPDRPEAALYRGHPPDGTIVGTGGGPPRGEPDSPGEGISRDDGDPHGMRP